MNLHVPQRHGSPVRKTVLGAWAALASAAVMAGPASDTVDALHQGLLAVMQSAPALGHDARAGRLRPLLEASYDLPFVTSAVMGDTWAQLATADRERAVSVFSDLTVATYAARFDGYAGERFETGSERALRGDRLHVRTRLLKPDGDSVQLDYVLHERDGRHRIINVVAEGVSDLALKRVEYAAVMRSEGFDGLMNRLLEQTAGFEGERR